MIVGQTQSPFPSDSSRRGNSPLKHSDLSHVHNTPFINLQAYSSRADLPSMQLSVFERVGFSADD